MKKKYWIIGGIAVLVIIGLANSQKPDTTQRVATQAVTSKPTATPTPKPMTFEEKVKAAAQNSYGQITEVNIDDAVDLDTNAAIPGQKNINITAVMNKAIGADMAKRDGMRLTTQIMQKLFPIDSSIYSLTIQTNIPGIDAYGQHSNQYLQLIIVTRATFDKINFTNFDYLNIPTVADSYAENHAIN